MTHWRNGKLPPELAPETEATEPRGKLITQSERRVIRKENRVILRRSDASREGQVISSIWTVTSRGKPEQSFSDEASATRYFEAEVIRSGG